MQPLKLEEGGFDCDCDLLEHLSLSKLDRGNKEDKTKLCQKLRVLLVFDGVFKTWPKVLNETYLTFLSEGELWCI